MKKHVATIALAAALAQPASAITFASLTTIYVGSGVFDNNAADNLGIATSIHCSNVSGVSAQVRALVLNNTGAAVGSLTVNLAHGATVTFSTHNTVVFSDTNTQLETGGVFQGVVNVEATESAVFCTAVVVDASVVIPAFMSDIHLVRVNPHPGTVE